MKSSHSMNIGSPMQGPSINKTSKFSLVLPDLDCSVYSVAVRFAAAIVVTFEVEGRLCSCPLLVPAHLKIKKSSIFNF